MHENHQTVGPPKTRGEDLKDLRKQIAKHGTQEIEVIMELNGETQTVKKTRVLLVLELLFDIAIHDRSLGAAQQYLDRMLGKPKESLSISDDGEGIGKLSDDQLIEKITTIIEATRKGTAGESD